MSLRRLIRQACTVTTRTQTGDPDVYGTPTWEETETETVCHVQPVASDEVDERPAGKLTHRGYLLPEAAVSHNDRLTLTGGESWEVDGPARLWVNPRTGRAGYQEVDLVAYTTNTEEESS